MAGAYRSVTDASPFAVLAEFVRALAAADLPYAVGGSLASSTFGRPRATHDADVLIAFDAGGLERLTDALSPEWYIPRESARAAVDVHASFGLLHQPSGLKVDVFAASDSGLDQVQLASALEVVPEPGLPPIRITAPHVILVRKLLWFRSGGEVSERQWSDVLGLLREVDAQWVRGARELARSEGVTALLERAELEARGA